MIQLPQEYKSEIQTEIQTEIRKTLEAEKIPFISDFEKMIIEQATEKGMQQGVQRGIQQSMQQILREMILDTLQIRFDSIPEPIENAISSTEDIERLKVLHKEAITVSSINEFINKL